MFFLFLKLNIQISIRLTCFTLKESLLILCHTAVFLELNFLQFQAYIGDDLHEYIYVFRILYVVIEHLEQNGYFGRLLQGPLCVSLNA